MNGNPIVVHLHGGHSDAKVDGYTESFYSPEGPNQVFGPFYEDPPGNKYYYESQPAAAIWYHDHALGITRLNVYTGMAGFYIIRSNVDSGTSNTSNPYNLPIFPYELPLAIQDRWFKNNGELFYPAFPGDPWYDTYLPPPNTSSPAANFTTRPSILTEFFGDYMVVNGKAWPKNDVEPRDYRLRLLNGCDSRTLIIEFYLVPGGATDWKLGGTQQSFTVIGKDQGLFPKAVPNVSTLVVETGSRYDVIFDFSPFPPGSRIIMANRGGDTPFGGDIPNTGPLPPGAPPASLFIYTDRIMAFDILNTTVPGNTAFNVTAFDAAMNNPRNNAPVDRIRKVALFEGMDQYGRLQPLLGTAEPATSSGLTPINWPDDCPNGSYCQANLTGPMEGAIAWHSPTTENPALNATEIWEIWNVSPDAHPIHLHLVHFQLEGRHDIIYDNNTTPGTERLCNPSATNGICLMPQAVVEFDGSYGSGFKIQFPTNCSVAPDSFEGNCYTASATITRPDAYADGTRMDIITALPGQVTRIKATFDKPGQFVWHCHILSHEDHEMMRTLCVGDSENCTGPASHGGAEGAGQQGALTPPTR